MKKLIILLACAIISIGAKAQIGIGTTTPTTTLDVRGSLAINTRSFSTTSESVGTTDYTLLFTGTSACTLTLPDATLFTGRLIHIKNTKTGTVPVLTIATTSSQTIDGSTTWLLDDPNESVNVVSDGTNWKIMGQSLPSGSGTSWTQGGNTVASIKKLGTIDNYDLPFITNNTEKMRLSTAGFLGIGTNNPGARIHAVSESSESGDDYVFDDYTSTTSQGMFLRRARGTVASPANLQNGDLISYLRFVGRYNGTLGYTVGSGIDAYYMGNGTLDSTDLRFFTSAGERMRIDHRGNVAIGTTVFDATNPEKFVVDAGVNPTSFNVITGKGSKNGYLQLNIQNKSTGNQASSDIVASSDNATELINYINMGINSSSYSPAVSNILNGVNTAYLFATGNDFFIGNQSSGKNLVLYAGGDGASDEKIRITPSDGIQASDNILPFTNNNYDLGSTNNRWKTVWTNNSLNTSDARLKTNITNLNYGLSAIMKMRSVQYNWKEGADQDTKIGFLAQDLRKIIPEVVVGNEAKENLAVNYIELIPVLVNAIKEQQQQIEELKKKVKALENK